jgi:hypothetical protein
LRRQDRTRASPRQGQLTATAISAPHTLPRRGGPEVVLPGRGHEQDRLTAGQLRAWLQDPHARWPATANPHLLINRSTGGGVKPVSRGYVQHAVRGAGITAADLRADWLLGEAHASGSDPLRLTHPFGISDPTAIRYGAETGPRGYDDYQAREGAAGMDED